MIFDGMKYWRCLLFTLFVSNVEAQGYRITERYANLYEFDHSRWGWGCYLGLNHFDFKMIPKSSGFLFDNDKSRFAIETQGGTGFTVGLMGKLKFHNNVDLLLEPGLSFVKRKIYFQNQWNFPDLNAKYRPDPLRNIQSTYIHIPLSVKLHGERFNNIRPFVAGGLGYAFNLESNQNRTEDKLSRAFRMKTHNFDWQAEAGVEIYFPHFKMVSSVKGVFFLNNELVSNKLGTSPVWEGSMHSLRTRAMVFSLRFE